MGLGVVGFSDPDSTDFFPDGAGVEEADDRPLLGLTGSFLALRSPFSFGGVLLSPLVSAAPAAAAALLAASWNQNYWKLISAQMCYVILL